LVCIFDCETIPDLDLAKKNYEVIQNDEILMCQEIFDAQEEKTGSSFLPIPFHKVVSISAVISTKDGVFKKVGTFPGDSEEKIISEFFKFINQKKPKLISFNGRGFDLPMLFVRALKYNLSIPTYFDNSDKWNNYRSRYSEDFHIDLLEVLGSFGAVRGLKLDVIAQMAGLPGKFDVSGDEVYKLYFEGELTKIQEYCESDTLNTYWLWLKYELLKGNISKEKYKENLQIMASKLEDNKSYTTIFRDFIKKELENA
jgi:predicted PolB exonuclease-like 3'-5' exonuclease